MRWGIWSSRGRIMWHIWLCLPPIRNQPWTLFVFGKPGYEKPEECSKSQCSRVIAYHFHSIDLKVSPMKLLYSDPLMRSGSKRFRYGCKILPYFYAWYYVVMSYISQQHLINILYLFQQQKYSWIDGFSEIEFTLLGLGAHHILSTYSRDSHCILY